jgi:lipopolysaccharide transport system ATP-binding protein
MSSISIRVEGLSKQYYIGRSPKFSTIREKIVDNFKAPFRRAGNLMRGQATGAAELHEAIWALKDVCFEIKPGESVGIIGRNGAGKSTLLKILSRITQPTAGYADIYGRVGALLEVGTGFHPELTGRENVYLNGSILGMARTEIDRKFDEIVDFSEVEKFIDTPIKHYSSGMTVRLAFAVAAHLEPEILVIDEVLSVGDAAFQKKCLNKMEDVEQSGRTILFVSHNMPAVTRLCSRAIFLQQGQLLMDGPSAEVVGAYLNSGLGTTAAREWNELKQAPGDDVVRLRAVRVRAEDGEVKEAVDIRKPVRLEMEYDLFESGFKQMPYFIVLNQEGTTVFTSIDTDPEWRQKPRPAGHYTSTAWIPGNYLAEGTHFVSAALRSQDPMIRRFHEREAIAFHVVDSTEGDSVRGDHGGHLGGVVRPFLKWETEYHANGNGAR